MGELQVDVPDARYVQQMNVHNVEFGKLVIFRICIWFGLFMFAVVSVRCPNVTDYFMSARLFVGRHYFVVFCLRTKLLEYGWPRRPHVMF